MKKRIFSLKRFLFGILLLVSLTFVTCMTRNNKEGKNKDAIVGKYSGKHIVSLGDSIFAYNQGETSISQHLQDLSGAFCYNCALGGSKMADDLDKPNLISFSYIVDAIVREDFTDVEKYINTLDGIPDYFLQSALPTLENIDFNEVDLLTIEYGTNDYNAGIQLNNSDDDYDRKTLCGALRYGVEAIKRKYPNIEILVITPIWRYYANGSQIDVDRGGGYIRILC